MHPYEKFKKQPFPRSRSLIEHIADRVGLNRFFLRPGKRPSIRTDEHLVVSPADCTLAEIQTLRPAQEIQGKTSLGHRENYSYHEIVHTDNASHSFAGGLCFNLYLSPLNLHYLLFPTTMSIDRIDYHPAFCYPILFMKSGEIRNERLVIHATCEKGVPIVIVLIGSFLVSGIECLAEVGKTYSKGHLMGGFKLGSTVMVLFPKDTVTPLPQPGNRLLFGEPLAEFL